MINLQRDIWSTFTSGNITINLKGYYISNTLPVLDAESFFYEFIFQKKLTDELVKEVFTRYITSGSFACIIKSTSKIYVVTDIIRSQPIHIIKNKIGFEVVDQIDPSNAQPLDSEIVRNFLDLGFSPGAANCFKDTYSLQAAEIVIVEGDKMIPHRYFRYIPTNTSVGKETDQLVKEFDFKLKSTINSMLLSAPSVKNWIIPLSGGHDSRLIINYLHNAGVKNVICFSYGKRNNIQSQLSSQVAKAAGYSWFFVEYTEKKWDYVNKCGLIDRFIEYAFQGVSTPHLQDFLAVYELKEKGIIKEGDIFVPGHSCITIPFTEETEVFRNHSEAILRCYNKCSKNKVSHFSKVPKLFRETYLEAKLNPNELYAYSNWQGRQTKFIGNSIRVYDFFGFQTRLPFWEKSFVQFWLSLSPSHRVRRNFMFIAERKGILTEKLRAIPFEDEVRPNRKKKTKLSKFKKLIPQTISTALLRITGKKQIISEGVMDIYSNRGKTIEDIIEPYGDFPKESHSLIKPYLRRYPYQMNFHLLTRLLTIRKAYDNQKKIA